MKLRFWKDLTEQEKEKRLKKIWMGSAIVLLVIIILLLMKCEGCSSASRKSRNYADGKGHIYGEKLSGNDIFDDNYGQGAEDYTSEESDQTGAEAEARRQAETAQAEEAKRRADAEAEKLEEESRPAMAEAEQSAEAKDRAKAEKEAEAERLAEEEKSKQLADEKAKKAAEEKSKKAADEKAKKAAEEKVKKAAEEKAKKAAEEKAKKAADEKARKAEAKKAAEEEKRKAEEAKKADEEKRLKQEAEEAAEKSLEAARKKAEDEKAEIEKNQSKLDEIVKRLENASSDAEKQKLVDEGLELAKKMIEKGSESDTAHYILAQDAQKKKNYQQALTELELAAAMKDNYLYYYDMGKLQYLLRRFPDAKASFIRSIELNNKFSPSVYNLGLTYVKLNDEGSALKSFQKSVEINPEYEKGYIEQARVYNRQGKLAECVKAYDTLIKLFPDNNSAIMELGSVYYQYGKYEESEAQYKQVLERLPKSEEKTLTAYNLSKVLYDDRKYAEASRYGWIAYDEKDFLLNDNQQANITYNYALIQEKNGKTDAAKKFYNEALQLNPAHTKSKINLSALYMSDANPDANKALELLLQAYKTDSSDFSVNNNLGTAYMLKDDYLLAEKYYLAALEIIPDDQDALLNLANAQTKAGKLSEAVSNFSKITAKNPENLEAYVGLAKAQIQTGDSSSAYKNLLYVKKKNPDFRKAEVDSLIAVLVD